MRSELLRGLQWLRSRDAGLLALRRAGRSAIIMPALLALSVKVIGNPVMATFAAFGSLAMLLFVAFGGRMRERLPDQVALIATGAVFVVLGTLCSRVDWLAALAMLVVAFFVLFAGVVSSALASASTSLLLAFILSVSLRGPVSLDPGPAGRLGLAAARSLIAIRCLWPARRVIRCADRWSRPAGSWPRCCGPKPRSPRSGRPGSGRGRPRRLWTRPGHDQYGRGGLRTSFFATPYRPTGLTTRRPTLVRLVDELIWLDEVLDQIPVTGHTPVSGECAGSSWPRPTCWTARRCSTRAAGRWKRCAPAWAGSNRPATRWNRAASPWPGWTRSRPSST